MEANLLWRRASITCFQSRSELRTVSAWLAWHDLHVQVPLEEMFEDLNLDETDEGGTEDDNSVPRDGTAGHVFLDEGDMDL